MIDPLARTALWTAAVRAAESERPDRLFEDPLAAAMAGDDVLARLAADPPESRDNPYLVICTRFFDTWLTRATIDSNIRQIVLLGAGMDTRAFRMCWPQGTTLFELDRGELLELKTDILVKLGAVANCCRRPVAADLNTPDWVRSLADSGFSSDKTAWVAEGVLEFMEEASVRTVLQAAAHVGGPGSRLGLNLLSRDLLTSKVMSETRSAFAREQIPWRFATNEPEEFLINAGWRAETVTQPGEVETALDRWPWPVVPRNIRGIPRSFLVSAVLPSDDDGRR
jgi:methyltransferase (TIGR00027 family)